MHRITYRQIMTEQPNDKKPDVDLKAIFGRTVRVEYQRSPVMSERFRSVHFPHVRWSTKKED